MSNGVVLVVVLIVAAIAIVVVHGWWIRRRAAKRQAEIEALSRQFAATAPATQMHVPPPHPMPRRIEVTTLRSPGREYVGVTPSRRRADQRDKPAEHQTLAADDFGTSVLLGAVLASSPSTAGSEPASTFQGGGGEYGGAGASGSWNSGGSSSDNAASTCSSSDSSSSAAIDP